MCGIVGIWRRDGASADPALLARMTAMLAHRGPDDEGIVLLDTVGAMPPIEVRSGGSLPSEAGYGRDLGLGHRRLAIIDLSDAAHQPMPAPGGRSWLVFNGEIYNFRELRGRLEAEGERFAGSGDTEVLARMLARYGADAIPMLDGIFAFAFYDAPGNRLLLARDMFGVKPLYYADTPGFFAFASEFKALLAMPGLQRDLDLHALDQYMTFLWSPDPRTMFKSVRRLPPGHVLVVRRDGSTSLREYWDLKIEEPPGHGRALGKRAEREYAYGTWRALESSVRREMISDAPLGAFLSGGIDSTAIVAAMAASGTKPTTYTVGFSARDLSYDIVPDDVRYARLAAKRFPIDYNEILLEPKVIETLPEVIYHMDDPVADPAAISAYLICRAARAGLKVLLSGMGGDEIFGGYPRYLAVKLADAYNLIPAFVRRRLIGPVLRRLPGAGRGFWVGPIRNAKKLEKAAHLPFEERYLAYLSYHDAESKARLYAADLRDSLHGFDAFEQHRAFLARSAGLAKINRMIYLDCKTFLPCLNLTYMDKMSMANSVEVRVPFLNREIAGYAARLPPGLKLKGWTRKYILKRAAEGHLPEEIIWRRKAGFGAPARAWLANELRGLVDDVLSAETIRSRGLFDPEAVRAIVETHRAGREDLHLQVWQLLTLELWMRTFADRKDPQPVTI
ncbi:MAG: asparagine synthase (glutamine-hydrolyzing) [Planctomycetota bacterium]|nr:asparagine synthase (glutamine-hydrolyzing) [Planctomycetota bacterium]